MFLRMTKNREHGEPLFLCRLGRAYRGPDLGGLGRSKGLTHKPTFAESVLESPAYSPELADSTTDFMPVGRLPV